MKKLNSYQGLSSEVINLIIENTGLDRNKVNNEIDKIISCFKDKIIDLKKMRLGVKSYVKKIESLLIVTLDDFNIDAHIKEGKPGVWVNNKKIGSIGIRVSRGITTHGFSLNVNTDMKYFSNIISCGIDDVLMTSMEKELGTDFFMNDIKQSIILHFNQLFKAQ